MTDSQHPNIDRLLEGTTPPITPWEQISEAIRTCVPDGDLGMVLRLMHDETRAQGERLAPELRAVLADNERLTHELDDLADFDKADERRRTLQDERDKAVKLWHEQHKELVEARADKGGLIIDLKVARADYLDMEAEAGKLRADLARAESEVAHWVAAESADIAAGSYAGEVERLAEKLARLTAVATPAQLLAAGSATAVSYAETVGRLRQQVAETKAKLAAASAELDAELTTTKRRLEVAYRREDDLRGAYEAAWAERNEARCMAHSLHAMLARVAEGYAETIGYDPRPERETLPDWLTDAEPPAVADGDAAAETGPIVGRDGAERGQEGPEGSKVGTGTTQAATEAPTPSGESDPTGGDR